MANQYTKLIINGLEVDLFDSEELPLNITKRVNNIDGKVQGDFSRASVTVPATKNNINILGQTRKFYPFRIEVDGAPSFSGTAQVKKGKTVSYGYEAIKCTYEINLISNNSSWFVLLGDTLLSDLTDEVVEFIAANVAGGFLSEPLVRNWVFMLIKFKEWANFVGGTHYAPSVFESTPGLNIKPLVIEAFNSIGYTVISDFFDTDLFSKLVIPAPIPEKLPKAYNDEYLNFEVSMSASTTFPVINSFGNYPFDQIDVAAPQNPTAYDNVLFEYTAPLSGYYELSIEFEFGATPPPPPYTWFITLEVNNVDVLPRIGFAFSNVPGGPQYPTAGARLTATGVVFLNAGDVANFRYVANGGITVLSATHKIEGEAILEAGIPIDFKYFLRDWKFIDMLKGLNAMFNLTYETDDEARTVTIEPKDNYLNTERLTSTTEIKEGFYQSTTKDYTRLIDYERKGTFEFASVPGRIDYKWNQDNEETIEWIEGINDLKIYESRFPMSSGADGSKTESFEVPFFVKSIHVLDVEAKFPNSTGAIPQFPLIYPQNYILDPTANEADYDISPRIFYHGGQRFGLEEQDGSIEIFEFPGIESRLPMTFMVNYNDDTGLDPNLGFNNQIINGVNSVGLLQKFYLQELARKDQGELRENYVQFNSVDELNFSFRIKGVIDSQRYVVQEIQGFNPLKDSPTNFKFYLDIVPNAADVANIQNSPLLSVVSFLSA